MPHVRLRPGPQADLAHFRQNLTKLRRLMAGHERYAALLLAVMLLAALAESLGLALVLPMISALADVSPATGPLAEMTGAILALVPGSGLEPLLGLLVLAFLAKGALLVLARGMTVYFSLRLREDWASLIFDHYLHAKSAYLAKKKLGKLVQNTANETHEAAQGIIRALGLVSKLILTLVLVVVLLLAHWQATLLVAAFGTAIVVLIRVLMAKRILEIARRRLGFRQQISAVAAESLGGVRQIKLFDQYAAVAAGLKDRLHNFTRADTLLQVASELPTQLTEVSIIALLAGALLALKYVFGVAFGEAVALLGFFIVVAQRLMSYLSYIVRQRMKIIGHLPSLALMHDLIERAPAREDLFAGAAFAGLESDIEFRHVAFHHADGTPVLTGLNLTIPKGATTAIVGPSGAGKSTIADLLLGLYRPDQGEIRINGRDLGEFSLASLRRHIGYVTQEPETLHASVGDNIRIGRPAASDEEVQEAARKAHADEFIAKLKDGYDTVVGERGGKLSGGQRQRLAIARVILRQLDLYIFDEATSALDAESERLVQESVLDLGGSATVVIIAHRLSTIERADVIYQIGEDGTARKMTLDEIAGVAV